MSDARAQRRTVLKRAATVLGIGAVAAAGGSYAGSRPTAAVSADDEFLARDVRVERNDGDVDAVTVAPELTVAWRDFDGGLADIDVTLSAAVAGRPGFDVLFDGSVDDDGVAVEGDERSAVSGTVELTFERRDLTAVGDAVTEEDFGGDLGPGESRSTRVELALRVHVEGSQGDTETAFETVEFEVTVVNPEGEATATGRANTDAE